MTSKENARLFVAELDQGRNELPRLGVGQPASCEVTDFSCR